MAAHGLHKVLVQPDAFRRQLVDARRRDLRRAVHADVVPAQVVREHPHDVVLVRGGGRASRCIGRPGALQGHHGDQHRRRVRVWLPPRATAGARRRACESSGGHLLPFAEKP